MISGNKKVPFPTISTMLFQIPMRKQGVKMSCSGNFKALKQLHCVRNFLLETKEENFVNRGYIVET